MSVFFLMTANKKHSDGECFLVRPGGLEPSASWFEAMRSIQLSYGRMAQMLSEILTRVNLLGILLPFIPPFAKGGITRR